MVAHLFHRTVQPAILDNAIVQAFHGESFKKIENEYQCELATRDHRTEQLEKAIEKMRYKQRESEWRHNLMARRADDADQYQRRLNLKLSGIPVKQNETLASIRDAV